jgi:hypothetical protein
MNGSNKLECYITLGRKDLSGDKHSSLLVLHISFNEKKVVNMAPYIMSMCYKLFIQGLYSQYYITL